MTKNASEGHEFTTLLDENDDIWWCCGGFNCYENFKDPDSWSVHAVEKHGMSAIPDEYAARFKDLGENAWMDLNEGPEPDKFLSPEYQRLNGTKLKRWGMAKRLLWRQSMATEQHMLLAKYGEEPMHGVDCLLIHVLKVCLIYDEMDPWICLANSDHLSYLEGQVDVMRDSIEWRHWINFLDDALTRKYVFNPRQEWPSPLLDEAEAVTQWTRLRQCIDVCLPLFQHDLEPDLAALMTPAIKTFIADAKVFLTVESVHAIWEKNTDKIDYMKRATCKYLNAKVEKRDAMLGKICDSILLRFQTDLGDTFFQAVDRGKLNAVVVDTSDEEKDRARYRQTQKAKGGFVNYPVCPNAPAKKGVAMAKKSEKAKSRDRRITSPTTPSLRTPSVNESHAGGAGNFHAILSEVGEEGSPPYKKLKVKSSKGQGSHYGGFNSSSPKRGALVATLHALEKSITSLPIIPDSEDDDFDLENRSNLSRNRFNAFKDGRRAMALSSSKVKGGQTKRSIKSVIIQDVIPLASKVPDGGENVDVGESSKGPLPVVLTEQGTSKTCPVHGGTHELVIPDNLPAHPPSMDLISLTQSDSQNNT